MRLFVRESFDIKHIIPPCQLINSWMPGVELLCGVKRTSTRLSQKKITTIKEESISRNISHLINIFGHVNLVNSTE